MSDLPRIPSFLNSAGPGAIVANDFTREPQSSRQPKPNIEPQNRIQAIRLAAAMEKLMDTAQDPGAGEDDGRIAASTLAMTMLEHFPTIIWALRKAGSPGER